jgi:hypothetical protein
MGIYNAPQGALLMFLDGAGTNNPQIAGSIDIFKRVILNEILIQPSASLTINGYLKDKLVQHQYTNVTTPATSSLTTQAQWNVTGSYMCISGDINHHVVLGAPESMLGRAFNVFKSETASTKELSIYSVAGINEYNTWKSTSPYAAIEVIWHQVSSKWIIKSSMGTWTGS